MQHFFVYFVYSRRYLLKVKKSKNLVMSDGKNKVLTVFDALQHI